MGTEDKYQFIHHKSRIVDLDSAEPGFNIFFGYGPKSGHYQPGSATLIKIVFIEQISVLN